MVFPKILHHPLHYMPGIKANVLDWYRMNFLLFPPPEELETIHLRQTLIDRMQNSANSLEKII